MKQISLLAVALLALGCAPDTGSGGHPLGDVSPDAGTSPGAGTLCEPSWTAPLRFTAGTERAGELRVTPTASGLRFELVSEDEDVRIGDAYVGVGSFKHLTWTSANQQPWITGWLEQVAVEVSSDAASGECGGALKVVVQARTLTPHGVRWISADAPGNLGPWGWYDLRPLCCDGGPEDGDGDGYASDVDCDDADASVHPGASELPFDGVDQDCDERDSVDVAEQVIGSGDAATRPRSASLADGTSLVVWTAPAPFGALSLQSRIIAADGTLGPIVTLGAGGTVDVASDGARFLVVVQLSGSIVGWFVGPDGTTSAPAFPITDPAGLGGAFQRVAYANGHYLVAYRTLDNPTDESINATVVSAAGVVGATFDVSTTLRVFDPQITTDGDRFLVSYTLPEGPNPTPGQTYTGLDEDVLARIVDPLTGPVGDEIPVATRDGVFGEHAIGSAGGTYLAVFRAGTLAEPDGDLFGQVIGSDGALLGGEIAISKALGRQYAPEVIGLDGEYVVAWVDSRFAPLGADDHRAIFIQRVSSSGALLGGERLITAAAEHDYTGLHLQAVGASLALATWLNDPEVIAALLEL